MSQESLESAPADGSPAETPRKRPSPVPLIILAIVFIAGLVMMVQGSLRRRLNDAELEAYLREASSGRDGYHAAEEISKRIEEKRPDVERFYPAVVAMAKSKDLEKRKAAAWVMGEDGDEESFRVALVALLEDRDPLVARNAALALVRHRSDAGREVLLSMLRPYTVASPFSGTFTPQARAGDTVDVNRAIGQLRTANGDVPIHPPFVGSLLFVAPAGPIAEGDRIATLAAAQSHAFDALRALMLPGIGRPSDVAAIEEFVAKTADLDKKVADQARLAIETLRARAESR